MLLMMFQQSDIDEILKIPVCMHQNSGSRQLETDVELKIPNKIKVFLTRDLDHRFIIILEYMTQKWL